MCVWGGGGDTGSNLGHLRVGEVFVNHNALDELRVLHLATRLALQLDVVKVHVLGSKVRHRHNGLVPGKGGNAVQQAARQRSHRSCAPQPSKDTGSLPVHAGATLRVHTHGARRRHPRTSTAILAILRLWLLMILELRVVMATEMRGSRSSSENSMVDAI